MESRGYGEGTRELLEGRRGGLVRSGLRQSPGVGASRVPYLLALLGRMEWDGFLLDASVVSYWALIFAGPVILVRE